MTRFSGSRLRAMRQAAGHPNRETLAVLANMSATSVALYEQGRVQPRVDHAAALARALNCQVDDFFDAPTEVEHDIRQLPPWAQTLIRDLQASRLESASAA